MKQGPNIEALVQLSYEKFYNTLPVEIAAEIEVQRPLFSEKENLQQNLEPLFAYFEDPNSQPETYLLQAGSSVDFSSALIGINNIRQRVHVSHFFLQHVIASNLHQHTAVQQLYDIMCNDLQQLINSLSSLYLANKVPVGHCQTITDWLREYYELFNHFQPQYQTILIGKATLDPVHKQAKDRFTAMIHNELNYAQTLSVHGNSVEAKKHIERAKHYFETLKSNFARIIKANHIDLKKARHLKSFLSDKIEAAEKASQQVYTPLSQAGATLAIFHTLLTFERHFPVDLTKLRDNIAKSSPENTFDIQKLATQITETIEGVQLAMQVDVPFFMIDMKIKNALTLLSQIDQLPSKQAAETILPLLIKLILCWQNFFKAPDILMKQNIEMLKGLNQLLLAELKIIRGGAHIAPSKTRSLCYLKAHVTTKSATALPSNNRKPALKPSKRSAARKKIAERRVVNAQQSDEENVSNVEVQIKEVTHSLEAISLTDDFKVHGKIIDIPPNIATILDELENAGFKAYIKGGFVRDSVLKIVPNDIDIITDCPSDKLLSVIENTLVKHPHIPDLFTAKSIDLTCSALPLLQEAKKCDLTINALFADKTGQVYDPLHIIDDVDKSILVMVGNPEDRIKEDPTRILRLIKAHFHLNKEIPLPLLEVVQNHAHTLNTIAFGKYLSNVKKIFCHGKAELAWDFFVRNQLLIPLLAFCKADTEIALPEQSLLNFIQAALQTLDHDYQKSMEDNNPYQVLALLLLPSLVKDCEGLPENLIKAKTDNLLENYGNYFGKNLSDIDRRCFMLATQKMLANYYHQFLAIQPVAATLIPTIAPTSILKIGREFIPQFTMQQQNPVAVKTRIQKQNEHKPSTLKLADFVVPKKGKK